MSRGRIEIDIETVKGVVKLKDQHWSKLCLYRLCDQELMTCHYDETECHIDTSPLYLRNCWHTKRSDGNISQN